MPTTPAHDAVDGLGDVVDELFVLAPEDFVARRDELAARARSAGERTLAAAVRRLKRPTTSAWALNLLSREEPGLVGQLLELGASLREAQSGLDGATLRELDKQRRAVVGALARRAGGLAEGRGHRLDAELSRQVEQSLAAALSDPDAGAVVTSGQLTRAVSVVGFGVEVDPQAVAVPALVLLGARRRRDAAGRRGGRPGGTNLDPVADQPTDEPATEEPRDRSRTTATAGGRRSTRTSGEASPTGSLADARARREQQRREEEEQTRRAELAQAAAAARAALAAARTAEAEAERSAQETAGQVGDLRTRLDGLRAEREDLAARLARCDEQAAETGARLTGQEQQQDEADRALLDARRATRRARRASEEADGAARS